MSLFLQELVNVFIFCLYAGALSSILLFVVFLLSFQGKIDGEKSSVYECGFNHLLKPIII